MILSDIPTDISLEELKLELEHLNFNDRLVKRFGLIHKSMPLCLVKLESGINAKSIFFLTDLFYLNIAVEIYKQSSPF